MLDNRPLAEQNCSDVEAFLQQQIGENLTLDYKRELPTSSDRDRAELCKDVSAFANSQGGMILYGLDEDSTDRTPQLPPFRTSRTVGRQSVEEWASQVLRSGVQPPLDFEMETFDYGGGPDRCVLVVRTGASPSAPHMVTLNGNNRYYGRFYRRSNYENEQHSDIESPQAPSVAPRRETTVLRIVRDTKQARRIKELYDYRCQMCGVRLDGLAGPYAEAAHIRPLGAPHHGPDTPENILCLCPNHHVLLDHGGVGIGEDLSLVGEQGRLEVHSRHRVSEEHIRYRREHYRTKG